MSYLRTTFVGVVAGKVVDQLARTASALAASQASALNRLMGRHFKSGVPAVLKAEMTTSTTSIGLSVRETAWVLTLSESQVRYQLRIGRLTYAVRPRLVSVESVRAMIPDDGLQELREEVLRRILRGELEAPKLRTRYQQHMLGSLVAAVAPPSWTALETNRAFANRAVRVH